jgi:hypothetical protein
MENNLDLDNSIYDIYNKLLTIKNKDVITNYPFNILNNDNVIFTKNQVELNYIKNYNNCPDLKKKGGKEQKKCIYFY